MAVKILVNVVSDLYINEKSEMVCNFDLTSGAGKSVLNMDLSLFQRYICAQFM